MGTWKRFTSNLDPWSYQNLLLRTAILREGKPDASRSTAMRYTLRRLRFTKEQKRAYAEGVRRTLEEEDPDLIEAIEDVLNGGG